MSSNNSPSLQDILKARKKSEFVGRGFELSMFRQNLQLSPDDEQRKFIINVVGPGGVGKSTLLRRFQQIAKDANSITAFVDDTESDILSVLARFMTQFKQQGIPLNHLEERYRYYRQKFEELDTKWRDKQLAWQTVGRKKYHPQSLHDKISQSFNLDEIRGLCFSLDIEYENLPGGETKANKARELVAYCQRRERLRELRDYCIQHNPSINWSSDIFDTDLEDDMTDTSSWDAFLRSQLPVLEDIQLILNPVDILTPLFLTGLRQIAQTKSIVIFCDTYEQTRTYLDEWWRVILQGRDYGAVSANIVIVLAGREELTPGLWEPYESLLARMSLAPFTDEEARNYLAKKKIHNEEVINIILQTSGRLPLLVATLAASSPNDPQKIQEPSEQAIERFFRWIDDPLQRRLILDAALARRVNADMLSVLPHVDQVSYSWLISMPFIQERVDGWAYYHDVVRMQMLRYMQRQPNKEWQETHARLADYFEGQRAYLNLDAKDAQYDPEWQRISLEILYHSLCQSPRKGVSLAVNGYLNALKADRDFADRWVEMIHIAEEDSAQHLPGNWLGQLSRLRAAYKEENHKEILRIYSNMLNQKFIVGSERAFVFARRGWAYWDLGHFEKALIDLGHAIEQDPSNLWALNARGRTYLRLKRYPEALADFNQYLALEPKAGVLANKGLTYYRMGHIEKALAAYEEALAVFPDHVRTLNNRASAYLQIHQYDAALADLEKAIELEPEHLGALGTRCYTLLSLGRYRDALDASNDLIVLNSSNPNAFNVRGWANMRLELNEAALNDFNQAIDLDPVFDNAISSRGFLLAHMGHLEEALIDCNQAVTLDEDNPFHLLRRGFVYRRMKRYEEALGDFERTLELNPAQDMAFNNRGLVFQDLGRYEDAIADFNKAIQMNPTNSFALVNRGSVYYQNKRYQEALADLNKARELQPENDWLLMRRAMTNLALHEFEETLADLNQAIDLNNQRDWLFYLRAITYLSVGKDDKFTQDLELAIQKSLVKYQEDPQNWLNTFNLIVYYVVAMDTGSAMETFQTAIEQGAPDFQVQVAIEDLDDYLALFPENFETKTFQENLYTYLEQPSNKKT